MPIIILLPSSSDHKETSFIHFLLQQLQEFQPDDYKELLQLSLLFFDDLLSNILIMAPGAYTNGKNNIQLEKLPCPQYQLYEMISNCSKISFQTILLTSLLHLQL